MPLFERGNDAAARHYRRRRTDTEDNEEEEAANTTAPLALGATGANDVHPQNEQVDSEEVRHAGKRKQTDPGEDIWDAAKVRALSLLQKLSH
jgi:hypothetical protein